MFFDGFVLDFGGVSFGGLIDGLVLVFDEKFVSIFFRGVVHDYYTIY